MSTTTYNSGVAVKLKLENSLKWAKDNPKTLGLVSAVSATLAVIAVVNTVGGSVSRDNGGGGQRHGHHEQNAVVNANSEENSSKPLKITFSSFLGDTLTVESKYDDEGKIPSTSTRTRGTVSSRTTSRRKPKNRKSQRKRKTLKKHKNRKSSSKKNTKITCVHDDGDGDWGWYVTEESKEEL